MKNQYLILNKAVKTDFESKIFQLSVNYSFNCCQLVMKSENLYSKITTEQSNHRRFIYGIYIS